jgi:hypothetical protein
MIINRQIQELRTIQYVQVWLLLMVSSCAPTKKSSETYQLTSQVRTTLSMKKYKLPQVKRMEIMMKFFHHDYLMMKDIDKIHQI